MHLLADETYLQPLVVVEHEWDLRQVQLHANLVRRRMQVMIKLFLDHFSHSLGEVILLQLGQLLRDWAYIIMSGWSTFVYLENGRLTNVQSAHH